tara:strand:+ start:761 stop:1063 length:303 start_codon:yes stop_codon:yes gene_type:complete
LSKLNKILCFKPNSDQLNALEKITNFLSSDCEDDVYILKGSSGTEKTSIVKAIVHHPYQEGNRFTYTERFTIRDTIYNSIYIRRHVCDFLVNFTKSLYVC